MDNESKGAYVRAVMDNLPTLARRPALAGGRPQKGKVLGPYNPRVYGDPSERDPVQSTRPNVTQNGHTERWNPPTALSEMGVGD